MTRRQLLLLDTAGGVLALLVVALSGALAALFTLIPHAGPAMGLGLALGLHPLAVVPGLVAGGQLAGLVGMLVADPALAVGKIVLWPALRDALAAPRGPDERPGAYA